VRRRLLMVGVVLVAGAMVYLLSVRPKEEGPGSLRGKVTLDGQPYGGATIVLRGQGHGPPETGRGKGAGPTITSFTTRTQSDADGRYRVDGLTPGLVYTLRVNRGDPLKEPLLQADGKLPSVEVGSGSHQFDIELSSAATAEEKARR
jgi:hypothetical protein